LPLSGRGYDARADRDACALDRPAVIIRGRPKPVTSGLAVKVLQQRPETIPVDCRLVRSANRAQTLVRAGLQAGVGKAIEPAGEVREMA